MKRLAERRPCPLHAYPLSFIGYILPALALGTIVLSALPPDWRIRYVRLYFIARTIAIGCNCYPIQGVFSWKSCGHRSHKFHLVPSKLQGISRTLSLGWNNALSLGERVGANSVFRILHRRSMWKHRFVPCHSFDCYEVGVKELSSQVSGLTLMKQRLSCNWSANLRAFMPSGYQGDLDSNSFRFSL